MTISVSVEKIRYYRPFYYHWHTANVMLEQAQSKVKGSYYFLVSSLVFRAFTFEAFLNHVGANLFGNWQEFERKGWSEKLKIIRSRCPAPSNFYEDKWPFIEILSKFRNPIAHGKDEDIILNYDCTKEEADRRRNEYPTLEHESFVSLENAAKIQEELGCFMPRLYKAALDKDLHLDCQPVGESSICLKVK